jgi:hypothetical protein
VTVTVEGPPHVDSPLVGEGQPETHSAVDSADIETKLEALGVDSVAPSVTEVLIEGEGEAAPLSVTNAVEVSFAKVTVSVLENPTSSEVEEPGASAAKVEVVVEMVMVTAADEVEVTVESVVHVVEFHNLTKRKFISHYFSVPDMERLV